MRISCIPDHCSGIYYSLKNLFSNRFRIWKTNVSNIFQSTFLSLHPVYNRIYAIIIFCNNWKIIYKHTAYKDQLRIQLPQNIIAYILKQHISNILSHYNFNFIMAHLLCYLFGEISMKVWNWPILITKEARN